MNSRAIVSRSNLTIAMCSLFFGLLSAGLLGAGSDGGGISSAPGGATGVTIATVHKTFSPSVAALAFVVGALLGSVVGMLWNRGGVARAASFIAIVLGAGMAGAACAGHFAAVTKITVSANSYGIEEGAPLAVIVSGGIAGMIVAIIGAWFAWRRFTPGPHALNLAA